MIAASAPLGVEIKILDGDLATVAGGVGELRETLPGGIYTVRWTAGTNTEQKVVRLRDGDTITLAAETLVPGAAVSEDELLASRQFAKLAQVLAAPMESAAELVVFVCANDVRTSSDVAGSVELRRIHEGPTRDTSVVRSAGRQKDEVDGWSVRLYHAEPGPYVLRYVSATRVTLEQTVQVVDGRRTVAWLRYGCAATTELLKEGAKVRSRRGIDPAKSRFVSFDGPVGEADIKSAYLLADILLHQLSARTGALNTELICGLGTYSDPYLRLFAASVLMTRPRDIDSGWPDDPELAMAVPEPNLSSAKALLAPLLRQPQAVSWPDLLCARWRLAMADGDHVFPEAEIQLPAAPMLESAWRWATAWTVERPVVDPASTPGLQAIGLRQERNTPWLTWRAADERRRAPAAPAEPKLNPEDMTDFLRAFTAASERLAQGKALNIGQISPRTLDLAKTVLRIGRTEHWAKGGALIHRLAGATGLPIGTLQSAVEIALEELDKAILGDESDSEDLLSSDPNKGRFGGKPSRDGLRLTLADFRATNHPEFLALDLQVAGSSRHRLAEAVTFHLHPTFNPAVASVAPVDDKATFTCYAWGAFTVGAETADGVRLELDLAEDERLPTAFRNR